MRPTEQKRLTPQGQRQSPHCQQCGRPGPLRRVRVTAARPELLPDVRRAGAGPRQTGRVTECPHCPRRQRDATFQAGCPRPGTPPPGTGRLVTSLPDSWEDAGNSDKGSVIVSQDFSQTLSPAHAASGSSSEELGRPLGLAGDHEMPQHPRHRGPVLQTPPVTTVLAGACWWDLGTPVQGQGVSPGPPEVASCQGG